MLKIFFLFAITIFLIGCVSSPRYSVLKTKNTDVVTPSKTPAITEKTTSMEKTNELEQDDNLYSFVNLYLGTPYKLSGNDKNGMDCSGFVGKIYQQVYGISLPRKVKNIWKVGQKISAGNLKEGDLLFFRRKKNNSEPTHVGIYIGNNKFAHSTKSLGVTISKLDDPYWSKILVGIRRVR